MKKVAKNKPKQGQIRIIGGHCRGRKLPVLNAEGLRPTSDRVKETLFNWLQFDIAGAYCLDVFAGSGGLGFEAASRSAKQVDMLELNQSNAQQLKQNIGTLKLTNITVYQTDSLQWLQQPAKQAYDVVFLDPPFFKDMLINTLNLLFSNGYMNERTLLYLEQENKLDWPKLPSGWLVKKEKKTSQVKYAVFYYESE